VRAEGPVGYHGLMAPTDRDLRLGLSGRTLAFPGGAPFCLVCGRRPLGLRTLSFKDAEYAGRQTETANLLLQRIHPLLAWANRARLVGFRMDVPLCLRHYWKGRGLEIGVIGTFLLATAAVIWLGVLGKLPRGATEVGSVMKGILISIVLVPGVLLWTKGRRKPVLPCDVRRESESSVVLSYPGEPPHP